MSGLPDIDVEDWRKHTLYAGGYDEDSEMIKVGAMFGRRYFWIESTTNSCVIICVSRVTKKIDEL